MATAPIHHEGKPLDDAATAVLVAWVRASAMQATSASLDQLAAALPEPIGVDVVASLATRFPDDIAVQRRVPYGSRPTRSCRPGAGRAHPCRGWDVPTSTTPGTWRAKRPASWPSGPTMCFHGPRATLGPPWAKDHRMAMATIVAG